MSFPCHHPAPVAEPIPEQRGRGPRPLSRWWTKLGDDGDWAREDRDEEGWEEVAVPHNWETYQGYRVVSHGNLHGTAWYRTRFDWVPATSGDRLHAFFEGVGSYASVFCNGEKVGEHAGGRTTFTLDLTAALREGPNLLAVRAHHPERIDDLPFVCGGCWGAPNTEGSQPFGLFRPAWLEQTGPVRIVPFGIHAVTRTLSRARADIEVRVELSNAGEAGEIEMRVALIAPDGTRLRGETQRLEIGAGEEARRECRFPALADPLLWGPGAPHLYRAVVTVSARGVLSHRAETTFGLRAIEWPAIRRPDADWNVVSPDGRGRLVGTGEEERTPENNGLTRLLVSESGAPVRLAPMGAAVVLSEPLAGECARLRAELRLGRCRDEEADLLCEIQNEGGTIFFHQQRVRLRAGEATTTHAWDVPPIHSAHLWTPKDPYLHKLLIEIRSPEGRLWERSETVFGIRDVEGPLNLARPVFEKGEDKASPPVQDREERRLLLNGHPLFLNGTCEYETLLGCDHAFTEEQIAANTAMMRAAGFNAFRDAHHPHNLRYYDHWDRAGIVCWTQMGSRLWFDTPAFRKNFRQSVIEWVRERRNHPSIILWGLQNESILPEDFAREMADLIRELDPESPGRRLTTTCNGGKGSDWNVPQEWSGTYGGNCNDYDLEALQLVGEYGAWRSFGLHTEVLYRGDENDRSESWACHAMETKIRRGEEHRERAVGHFHWLFNSFPNPGRTADNCEGAGNARVGSVNNKGLVTVWQQPCDLFYLYRANYADRTREPMVYIVSHTWPGRWKEPQARTVRVYSNCDEVELFNGVGLRSLGRRRQPGRGRHFVWEAVLPETNLLQARGRVAGTVVAEDLIVLDHLPADPSLREWLGLPPAAEPDPGIPLHRVSCGAGVDWTDGTGRRWEADAPWTGEAAWGWVSWGSRHAADGLVPADVASRGETMTPVRGTSVPELYRAYRYGRDRLQYRFRVGAGRYRLRLHLTEPWFGVGGGMDCRGWRLFDVAVNGATLTRNLDVWSEAGGDHRAVVREWEVEIEEEILTLHFPMVKANQALLCGIEVFACGQA